MRHRPSLRPAVESLDSRLLLSTIAPAGLNHSAQVHAERTTGATTSAPVATVALHGTIHATGTIASTSGKGDSLAGSGNLGAVGVASIQAKFLTASSGGSAVLSTKLGKIDIATGTNPVDQSGTSGLTATNSYTITGGTGSYAHTTGSGTITVTISSSSIHNYIYASHGNKIPVNLTFS